MGPLGRKKPSDSWFSCSPGPGVSIPPGLAPQRRRRQDTAPAGLSQQPAFGGRGLLLLHSGGHTCGLCPPPGHTVYGRHSTQPDPAGPGPARPFPALLQGLGWAAARGYARRAREPISQGRRALGPTSRGRPRVWGCAVGGMEEGKGEPGHRRGSCVRLEGPLTPTPVLPSPAHYTQLP